MGLKPVNYPLNQSIDRNEKCAKRQKQIASEKIQRHAGAKRQIFNILVVLQKDLY